MNWPETLHEFRFQWTAEPGIDLTAGAGVLIRAYLESYEIAEYTFDSTKVYPGALIQLIGVRPLGYYSAKTPQDARPHYGFMPYHVLEITPLDTGYVATVCSAEYGSFIQSDARPGKFISISTVDETVKPYRPGPTGGVFVHRVEFTQHDPRVGSTPPQPPSARTACPRTRPGGRR